MHLIAKRSDALDHLPKVTQKAEHLSFNANLRRIILAWWWLLLQTSIQNVQSGDAKAPKRASNVMRRNTRKFTCLGKAHTLQWVGSLAFLLAKRYKIFLSYKFIGRGENSPTPGLSVWSISREGEVGTLRAYTMLERALYNKMKKAGKKVVVIPSTTTPSAF